MWVVLVGIGGVSYMDIIISLGIVLMIIFKTISPKCVS